MRHAEDFFAAVAKVQEPDPKGRTNPAGDNANNALVAVGANRCVGIGLDDFQVAHLPAPFLFCSGRLNGGQHVLFRHSTAQTPASEAGMIVIAAQLRA